MDIASSLSTYRTAESSSAESPAMASRPLTVRSALTNDPLKLRGIDGRSVDARRYRDVAIALADDLGGQDKLNESCKILVRQAAALTVQVEGLQSKIVAGGDVDLEQLTRLSNVLGRTLQRLGIRKRAATKLDRRHGSHAPRRAGDSGGTACCNFSLIILSNCPCFPSWHAELERVKESLLYGGFVRASLNEIP
jgi:hypothetical protein